MLHGNFFVDDVVTNNDSMRKGACSTRETFLLCWIDSIQKIKNQAMRRFRPSVMRTVPTSSSSFRNFECTHPSDHTIRTCSVCHGYAPTPACKAADIDGLEDFEHCSEIT
jgi:hypothetical protein